MNEVLKVLKERRSVRKYKAEQIRDEELNAILEAGTWAPSAKGLQTSVMVVVQDPETIAWMSKLNAEIQGNPGTDPFYGAPTVVVVLGDGEMAEGSNYEGMMAAGHYKLDNLCAAVDLNRLQISGTTEQVMDSSDLAAKFRDFGWNVIEVEDGNSCGELVKAYEKAEKQKGKPSVVIAHTVKGKGVSFMEDQASWHHGTLTEEQYRQAVKELEEVLQ